MTRKPTEQVLGSELSPGDVVWSQGYQWRIDRVVYDPAKDLRLADGLGRWYLYAKAVDAPDLPEGYRNHMELALREDLHWTREIQ